MKKVVLFLLVAMLSLATFAQQVPYKFNFATMVTNATGELVRNQKVGVKISILRDNVSGPAVYVEGCTPTTDANGMLQIVVGDGTVVSGDIAHVNWAIDNYYIKCEIDPSGSNKYSLTTVQQLLSVPYAFYAQRCATGVEKRYVDSLYNKLYGMLAKKNGDHMGALKGVFSVSPTTKVSFSQGNLQYKASTKSWRFAENQYDVIGEKNSHIGEQNADWIDLFGWGTSGYDKKMPYMTNTQGSAYGKGTLSLNNTNYDWGVFNAITNGGNFQGGWRTLTLQEWKYLFEGRENAKMLRARAVVNDVRGYIFLPDKWLAPATVTFVPNGTEQDNHYNLDQWTTLQASGAVFLPVTGYREGVLIQNSESDGFYWSASSMESDYAYYFYFSSKTVNTDYDLRSDGRAVRLVQEN